jgi:signal transduction histidine kinase/ActR/RegA family two-component response regulator
VTNDEDAQLRSVALQNAQAILLARQRAEQELVQAKEALEQTTRELAHSLAMMRATLEATTDGILVTNAAGAVTDFNETYVTMWRLPREVLDSRQHSRVLEVISGAFGDPEAFLARVREIEASGQETYDVLELADGRVFERYTSIQRVDGRNVGRVWSVRDITDQRRRLLDSERLARADAERASAMKDEFLATLSHELRTPLNAILGWSKILCMPGVNPVDFQRGLEVVERNARIQAQLIEDLLDMSRITSGKMRLDIHPVSPAAVIEAALETVRPLAQAKGVLLTSTLDEAAALVNGDPNRLQQVVWNLLSNAIKFTDRHGRVQVSLRRAGSHVVVAVADTGVGIASEFLPHVFDRFRQADSSSTRTAGGLGLGLAIVKHLVELHGGTVQAQSPGRGAGTTFTIELPLVATAAQAATTVERPRARGRSGSGGEIRRLDLTGVKVLVVDDNADARALIQRVLEACGANVVTAGTVSEAVLSVERARPHVLVSDVGMPEADGYELLRLVRGLGQSRGGGLPAIALTAFARSEDRTRALRAGFLHHIAKPVEPAELVATVASVVGRTGEPVRD